MSEMAIRKIHISSGSKIYFKYNNRYYAPLIASPHKPGDKVNITSVTDSRARINNKEFWYEEDMYLSFGRRVEDTIKREINREDIIEGIDDTMWTVWVSMHDWAEKAIEAMTYIPINIELLSTDMRKALLKKYVGE